MSTVRKSKVLLIGTSASTGDWYQLDYRFDVNTQRTLFGTVTSGDTIYIEATPQPIYNIDGTAASVSVIVTIGTQTTAGSFNVLLEGPFAGIRARKTGTAGTCIVQGVL